MLEKKHRVLATKDFQRVFAKGGLVSEPLFLMRYMRREKPESRFGFVVSTKVSKKAVERNKIKRRLRAIAGNATPFLRAGYDYIFITKKNITQAPFAALKESVMRALQKAK